MAHSSDYFVTLMKVFDIVYGEMMDYFIQHSPKHLVKTKCQVNHTEIQKRCVEKLQQFSPYTLSVFKEKFVKTSLFIY